MPVSIVRRYAVRAFVAATVLATLAAVASFVVVAASPSFMAPSFMAQTAAPDGVETARIANSLDVMRVDLVPGSSEARYRAQEVLASRGNNEAVGRTPDVSGSILLYSDGTVLSEQSRITVDMRTLQSDSTMRDNYIKRSTLQVDEHPMADFVVTSTPGLPAPLPKSGTASFELVGDLTVHGVTRPTTWQATATFAESEVTGSATTTVLITDFGMTPPKVGSVLSIEDAVQLELDVGGTVAPSLADLLSDVE